MNLTIICAAPFEAQESVESLTADKHSVKLCCFGVGAITSARNAYTLNESCLDQDVIYLGTCGAFEKYDSPEVFLIDAVSWLPYGERVQECYRISNSDPTVLLNKAMDKFQDSLPVKKALCASSISNNSTLLQGMNPNDYVENIELYSIAQTVMQVSKSFSVLLTTTNLICQDAHNQWLADHKKAAKLTADTLVGIL